MLVRQTRNDLSPFQVTLVEKLFLILQNSGEKSLPPTNHAALYKEGLKTQQVSSVNLS